MLWEQKSQKKEWIHFKCPKEWNIIIEVKKSEFFFIIYKNVFKINIFIYLLHKKKTETTVLDGI